MDIIMKQHEAHLRRAIKYAQKRGWPIVKNVCMTEQVRVVKGKKAPTICVCPIMALVLMHASERSVAAQLKKGDVSIGSTARRAATLLRVSPYVVQNFMGAFDGNPDDDFTPHLPKHTLILGERFAQLAQKLAKELKPRAP